MGSPPAPRRSGVPRPDVCAVYPSGPGCPNVGYTFSLNTSTLAGGSHVITVTATDSDGQPESGSANTTLSVVVPPSVMIDSITPGASVSGTVTVSGWAIDNTTSIGTAIGSVQILVDGTAVGVATYGTNRADVCTTYPGRVGCPNVGFTYALDTSKLTPATHSVTAVATDTDLTPDQGSWTVNINVGALPTLTIETPASGASLSGAITISGWALDLNTTVGTPISSVTVALPGTPAVAAQYGITRPDVCTTYPGRAGCPNVGFSYTLGAGLTGPQTVTVTATDSSSPPNSTSSTITFNVTSGGLFNLEAPANNSTVSGVITVSGWAIAPPGSDLLR